MRSNHPIHLFFLEATLALLVLALVSVVLIRGFIKADTMATRAVDQSQGIVAATQWIEEVKAGDTLPNLPAERYYDEDWQIVSRLEAVYTLTMVGEADVQGVYGLTLKVWKYEALLIEVPFGYYITP